MNVLLKYFYWCLNRYKLLGEIYFYNVLNKFYVVYIIKWNDVCKWNLDNKSFDYGLLKYSFI